MYKFSKIIHDKNIVIKAEKELEPQVNTLFMTLGNFNPKQIKAGSSFEIGFSVYIIEQDQGDYLIRTPDYSSNPFSELTDDLTLSLWIQLEQGHLLRKLNIEGCSVRFDDKIVYADGAFNSNQVYLQRTKTDSKMDSGWYIGIRGGDNDNLKACYAYQLLKMNRNLIQLLALPFEYLIVLESNEIKAILDENNQNIWNA